MWADLKGALDDGAPNRDVCILALSAVRCELLCRRRHVLGGGVRGRQRRLPSHTQLERMQWINGVVLSLRVLKVPTIARVNGLAVDIGMNLAMCCDFVASRRARFSEIFVRRALSVDGRKLDVAPARRHPASQAPVHAG